MLKKLQRSFASRSRTHKTNNFNFIFFEKRRAPLQLFFFNHGAGNRSKRLERTFRAWIKKQKREEKKSLKVQKILETKKLGKAKKESKVQTLLLPKQASPKLSLQPTSKSSFFNSKNEGLLAQRFLIGDFNRSSYKLHLFDYKAVMKTKPAREFNRLVKEKKRKQFTLFRK